MSHRQPRTRHTVHTAALSCTVCVPRGETFGHSISNGYFHLRLVRVVHSEYAHFSFLSNQDCVKGQIAARLGYKGQYLSLSGSCRCNQSFPNPRERVMCSSHRTRKIWPSYTLQG